MSEAIRNVDRNVWIFAITLIALVIIQATLFLRHALNFTKETNVLTPDEVKQAVRTGGVSVIGPALSVIVIALSLISFVGPATTFMRVGVIGSASFELNLANIAASSQGVELGSPDFTEPLFVVALFGMILGSWPYFINCIITLKPMDMALTKASTATSKKSFVPMIGLASSIGLLGYFSTQRALAGTASLLALISSGISAYLMKMIIKKTGKKALGDWILAVGIVVGMVIAGIYNAISA